jgi:inorganic triphosphatase YgiF
VAALGLDALDAQIRQVFFFDTPDLDLNRAGVVVRARRIQASHMTR